MDEFVTYILYSTKYQKIYIGYTGNLIQRYQSHNFLSKKGYTTKYRPWKVIFVKFHTNKKEALQYEKYLKSGVGRSFIHNTLLPKIL